VGGPAGAGDENQATEKTMTTNVQSTHTKNELLRELVIAIGCLAMLLSGVGALYWMQTRPDEAAAGQPADAKPLETPRPKLSVPTADGVVVHADVYNKVLAQRRADTVKQFLVELGVPESSVKVVALGPEAALCDDPGKECQQLNRRVHLEIRRLGPMAAVSTTSAAPAAAAPVAPANVDVQKP
jgi:hypothetical protein